MQTVILSQDLLNSFANAIHSLVLTKQKQVEPFTITDDHATEHAIQSKVTKENIISPIDLSNFHNEFQTHQCTEVALDLQKQKLNASNQKQVPSFINEGQLQSGEQFKNTNEKQNQKTIKTGIESQAKDYIPNFQLVIPILCPKKSGKTSKKSCKTNEKAKVNLKVDCLNVKEPTQQKSQCIVQIEHEIKKSQESSLNPLPQNNAKKIAKKGSKKFDPKVKLNEANFKIFVQEDPQIKQYLQRGRMIYRVKRENELNNQKTEINKINKNISKMKISSTHPKLQKAEFEIAIQLIPFQQPSKLQNTEKSHLINNIPQQLNAPQINKKQTKQAKRFQGFLRQRSKNTDQIMNIGIASLLDIVQQLAKNYIISQDQYNHFASNHTIYDIRQFLDKFKAGILHKFDFATIKFTLLDHRRLSQLLLKLFPDKYTFTVPYAIDGNINDFLISMYDLPAQDYFNLYTRIDNISKIKWWSQIIQEQKNILLRKTQEQKNTNYLQSHKSSVESKNIKRNLHDVYNQSSFIKIKPSNMIKEKKTQLIASSIKKQISFRIPQSIISLRQKLKAN